MNFHFVFIWVTMLSHLAGPVSLSAVFQEGLSAVFQVEHLFEFHKNLTTVNPTKYQKELSVAYTGLISAIVFCLKPTGPGTVSGDYRILRSSEKNRKITFSVFSF